MTAVALIVFLPATFANPPVAKYIFPAGGQRGTTVHARVGGCFFHGEAGFEMLGPGVETQKRIRQIDTIWFESPLIPQPASQQAEDYPKDYACTVKIARDTELGPRAWRAWTSQGATAALPFVIGDLPEVVEREADGKTAPVEVKMPVTINGRIFPRENVDAWTFHAAAGQQITCDANAKRLGSPLDAELQVFDPAGKPVAGKCVRIDGDPRLHFTAAVDGLYQVRIHDVAYGGLQNYVYRLTISAAPSVDFVYPLGGMRGSRVHFDLLGHALSGNGADASLPGAIDDALPATTSGGLLSVSGAAPHRGESLAIDSCLMQFDQQGRRANPIPVAVDDLPEILESEPNDRPADVRPVEIPAVLNGRIDHPGDVDYWAFDAKKSQVIELDVWASRLGSRLDSVLSIEDGNCKQLARNDDRSPGQPDSRLTFKPSSDGIYYIRMEDRFATRGGKEFAYRLYVIPSEPDFRLTLAADTVTLPRAVVPEPDTKSKKPISIASVKVDLERLGGFNDAVQLAIDGLPDGVTAHPATMRPGQNTDQIFLTAAPTTKIDVSHVRVYGVATIAKKSVARPALFLSPHLPPMDDVLLSVAMVTPFKEIGVYEHPFVPCGSIFHRRYALDRGGFQGPITVSVADRQARHLQGVWGPTLTIPAGADSFDYWMGLACEMELGRTSRAVMALTATVKDFDGSEHVVSYSSVDPNDQFVSVVTASQITIGLDQTSLLARVGSEAELPVHVQCARALAGQPVKVELILPPGVRDVRADPLKLEPGQSQGVLHIHFGGEPIVGPVTATIRATVAGPIDPSQAESKIDFVLPN